MNDDDSNLILKVGYLDLFTRIDSRFWSVTAIPVLVTIPLTSMVTESLLAEASRV